MKYFVLLSLIHNFVAFNIKFIAMKNMLPIERWFVTILFLMLPALYCSAWTTFDDNGFSYYYPGIGDEVTLQGTSHTGDVVIPSEIIHGGVLYKVTYIGSYAFKENLDITSITISNGVRTIGAGAFMGCTNLTAVSLPSSLTTIGMSAFQGCTKLASVAIPNSVTAMDDGIFQGCAGLTSFTFSEGMTKIPANTFDGCSSLKNVSIPKCITNIGGSAFNGCSGLVSMTIPESVTSIGASAFEGCTGKLNINCNIPNPPHYDLGVFYGAAFTEVVMGDSVKSIGWNAFGRDGNNTLTSVTIGKNVETIGDRSFFQCSGLTTIVIPNSVKTIGNQVFFRCSALETATIGSGLESMGSGVFQECTALDSVSILSGSIGSSAFASCTNLKSLTLGNGVTSIGEQAFGGCASLSVLDIPESVETIGRTAFYECSGLTSVFIPSSVTSIGEWAFGYCTGKAYINCNFTTGGGSPFSGCRFTEVTIGDGVTQIDNQAFRGITTLAKLSLPDGLQSIGEYAFFECTGLTTANIPASVTYIGERAFSVCKNLNLTSGSVLSCEIGNEAFAGCTKLTAVTFGPNVGNIGTSAFARCEALASVTVPKGVTKMKSIGQYAFSECSLLAAFDFPNSIDSIAYAAFEKCYSLTTIDLPEGLRTIDGNAFFGCSGVTSVIIPASVENMGSNIFNGCQGTAYIYCNLLGYSEWSSPFTSARFSSIVLGENVTNISDWIFYHCQQLRNVTVQRTTPVEIGGAVFPYRTSSTLYCPNGGKSQYMAADYWKEFKNIIGPQYALIYKVDGEVVKTDSIDVDAPLSPIDEPTKEGYTFGGWSELPETMPDHDVVVTGRFYLYGDVNADEEVDVVDVVDIARFVVGTPSVNFNVVLADLNGNKTVNLGDAVVLVNHIAGDQNFVKPMRVPRETAESSDVLSLTQNGDSLSLNLTNSTAYTAFQFELYFSETADVETMKLSIERKQRHQLLYNKVEDGHYSVAALSVSNKTFLGSEGELLSFILNGEFPNDVTVCNIRFFDTEGNEYLFDDIRISRTDGIGSIENGKLKMGNAVVYDLQGRRLSRMQRGINILNGRKVVLR